MRRRGWAAYWWVIAILLMLAGFAWLTQNPEAEFLERAQEWPVVGRLATSFRQAYLPPPPVPRETLPEAQPGVEVITLPPVNSSEPRYVWVQPGDALHTEPDVASPVVETMTSIRNLSVVLQRGDWYRVWVPRSGARPLQAWVLLMGYEPPSPEVLQQADPVLPLPASPPDASRIAVARQLMANGGEELECGCQPLFTDASEDDLIELCAPLTSSLEDLYQGRYGLQPVGPPAEAVLLFRRAVDYRKFRDLEKLPFDTGLAHASPARGYLAIYRGERTTGDVLATLVHESTHLLTRRSLGPALPPWLAEGMADDLAESQIDTRGVIIPDRLGGDAAHENGRIVRSGGQAAAIQLQEAIEADALPTLRELVAMEESQFYRSDRVQLSYALSSFWVRYLASDFDPGLTRGFRQYLQDIASGVPLDTELLRIRLGRDWDDLESGFRIWVHLQFIRPPNEDREASS